MLVCAFTVVPNANVGNILHAISTLNATIIANLIATVVINLSILDSGTFTSGNQIAILLDVAKNAAADINRNTIHFPSLIWRTLENII